MLGSMRKDSNDRRFTSRPHSNHFHLPQRAHEALSIWTGLYMWIYICVYIYECRTHLSFYKNRYTKCTFAYRYNYF